MAAIRSDSVEYLNVPIAGPSASTLTAAAIACSIVPNPTPGTYIPVDQYDSVQRIAKILVGTGSTIGALTPGTYYVFIRVQASPEIPVMYAGQLTVE